MPVHGAIISDYISIALASKCLKNLTKTLSHLSAHVVNRRWSENLKSIPNCLMVKKKKKKKKTCNPPDFKSYLDKLNNKKILIWCNVKVVSIFTALNNTKKQRKYNITPFEEFFFLSVNLLR